MGDSEATMKALADFFPSSSLGWLAVSVSRDKDLALALPYIDARDVMDRLDSVLGPLNWQDSYDLLSDGLVRCRLSIRVGGEWITKEDAGGSNVQDNEDNKKAVDKAKMLKSAFSDAMKRAAVHFGIGRYLYRFPDQWVDYDKQYKRFKKVPNIPVQFMLESERSKAKSMNDRFPNSVPADQQGTDVDPNAAKKKSDSPASGKALKDRLEKAEKGDLKGVLQFVANCGQSYGYPLDITKWSGAQLDQSVEFGKEFARRRKEKVARLTKDQDREIKDLIAGDLDKLVKACQACQVFAVDFMAKEEAARVIEFLKK